VDQHIAFLSLFFYEIEGRGEMLGDGFVEGVFNIDF
jgi:hypothetical protein